MPETGEAEPQPKPGGWGKFVEAAKGNGAQALSYEKLPDGSEVLSQKLGEGWHGLGYDGTNFWLGLTPAQDRVDHTGFRWNGNTKLRKGVNYKSRGIIPGVKGRFFGKEGRLLSSHPIAQLFSHLQQAGVEVHITGEHVGWERSDKTRLKLLENGDLLGDIPTRVEIKALLTNISANWDDQGWNFGKEQVLTVKPQ